MNSAHSPARRLFFLPLGRAGASPAGGEGSAAAPISHARAPLSLPGVTRSAPFEAPLPRDSRTGTPHSRQTIQARAPRGPHAREAAARARGVAATEQIKKARSLDVSDEEQSRAAQQRTSGSKSALGAGTDTHSQTGRRGVCQPARRGRGARVRAPPPRPRRPRAAARLAALLWAGRATRAPRRTVAGDAWLPLEILFARRGAWRGECAVRGGRRGAGKALACTCLPSWTRRGTLRAHAAPSFKGAPPQGWAAERHVWTGVAGGVARWAVP